MRYRHVFASTLILGLVSLAMLSAEPAAADPYSGLAGRDAGAPATGVVSPSRQLGPSSVPSAPVTPTPATRPATWPGQAPEYPSTGYQPAPWMQKLGANRNPSAAPVGPGQPGSMMAQVAPIEAKMCEDAQIIARVGTEVIQVGDVKAAFVYEKLEALDGPLPEEYHEKMILSFLPHAIVTKLKYVEAVRSIPEENHAHVKKEIKKFFASKALPELMKRAEVETVDELGQKLADLGTSLEWQQRMFMERVLGDQWMGGEVDFESSVSPEEMLAYYQEHLADYEHEARVRWEELMVRFSETPTRDAAFQKLANLGNQVLGGLPFAEAARRGSGGATASEGGTRDWTTRGSLVSERVDDALFRLPVGQLSPILEGEHGFHIVRVVERQDAYRTPFTEVQEDIRKAIQKARAMEQSKTYIAKLRDNTPIWTIYDDAVAGRNQPKTDETPRRR